MRGIENEAKRRQKWHSHAMPYASDLATVEWRFSDAPVAYPDAVAAMEDRVAAIRAGSAPDLVWLLEHPPLYTAGTSARPAM
jgi:lipoyl(octanoyl) transferase